MRRVSAGRDGRRVSIWDPVAISAGRVSWPEGLDLASWGRNAAGFGGPRWPQSLDLGPCCGLSGVRWPEGLDLGPCCGIRGMRLPERPDLGSWDPNAAKSRPAGGWRFAKPHPGGEAGVWRTPAVAKSHPTGARRAQPAQVPASFSFSFSFLSSSSSPLNAPREPPARPWPGRPP